jgi:VanZ family protein
MAGQIIPRVSQIARVDSDSKREAEGFGVAAACGRLLPCAVQKARLFLRYWLPVLVWVGIIFSASGDAHSAERSSRIIAPLLRWLLPDSSEEAVQGVVLFVRKCGHVAEYAVLALLLWRGLRGSSKPGGAPWRWSEAGLALGLTALYAASDELHQTFVPSRQGSAWDVLLDTSGAVLALLCLWGIGRLRKRW